MIRARMNGALLLGIDVENVHRLTLGYPIHVHIAEVENGHPITSVTICYGATLQHIVEDMKKAGMLPPDFVPPPVQQKGRQ